MTVYLDNAATSFPKPEKVYRAVDFALREIGTSPGRGSYKRAIDASRLVFETRELLSTFLGGPDISRLIFTHSTTESLNIAVNGLVRPGQHIVAAAAEHNSLVRPIRYAEKRGIDVTWLSGDCMGIIDSAQVMDSIRPETSLVAISHCSNVTGTIQPVAEIGAVTRAKSVALLVDAAQSAGNLPIDVTEMKIDLLAAPGHKGLLGLQGTGVLYVGQGLELAPLMVGGTGSHSSGLDHPDILPDSLESGTLNLPGLAGLKAGVEYILEIGLSSIRAKEMQLVGMLLTEMNDIHGVKVYGLKNDLDRHGTPVSFTVEGMDTAEVGFVLDHEYDISVRTGLHCAPATHQAIGTYPAGTVRVSPGWFTTEAEIDIFLDALRKIATGASRRRR